MKDNKNENNINESEKNKNEFEIESFTEDDLFDGNLSKKQIEKTKKTLSKTINLLKELNSQLDIDVTLEDVLKLKRELGEDFEKIEFGVKYAPVLRKIVLDAIDKDIKKNNIEVIDQLFVTSQIAIPGRVDTVALHDAAYFYKMYLTKDNLISYSLNDKYKIISKRIFKFDEIRSIGKAPQYKGWAKGLAVFADTFDGKMSYIEPNDRTTIYLNHQYIQYEEHTFRFLDKLSEVGKIKIVCKDRLDQSDYIGIVGFILFIGWFLFLTINNILLNYPR
ncbi:MAG: hypothetical protein ACRC3Y_03630 [Romboutsia sp.]|uniref:hypothetical protein n=1 Tax=Romboutsia sp. TaxID=1965302 RepID=UPI003F3E0D0A